MRVEQCQRAPARASIEQRMIEINTSPSFHLMLYIARAPMGDFFFAVSGGEDLLVRNFGLQGFSFFGLAGCVGKLWGVWECFT